MNPEVLSLIKLAAVFAIIIGLLSMKKPLNLVMSIASVVVVVLYAMPSDLVLPDVYKRQAQGIQGDGELGYHISSQIDKAPLLAAQTADIALLTAGDGYSGTQDLSLIHI